MKPPVNVYSWLAAVCAPQHRLWLDALLHESTAVEGEWERLFWTLGVGNLLLFSLGERGRQMMANRFGLSVALSIAGMVICGIVASANYEGIEYLDDIFLGLALVFGAIFAGLVALVLGRFLIRAWAESAR